MPLKKCSKDGKSGWKWGDAGACYTGPGAKKKAIKQGIAIEGPKKFAQEATADPNIMLELSLVEQVVVNEMGKKILDKYKK